MPLSREKTIDRQDVTAVLGEQGVIKAEYFPRNSESMSDYLKRVPGNIYNSLKTGLGEDPKNIGFNTYKSDSEETDTHVETTPSQPTSEPTSERSYNLPPESELPTSTTAMISDADNVHIVKTETTEPKYTPNETDLPPSTETSEDNSSTTVPVQDVGYQINAGVEIAKEWFSGMFKKLKRSDKVKISEETTYLPLETGEDILSTTIPTSTSYTPDPVQIVTDDGPTRYEQAVDALKNNKGAIAVSAISGMLIGVGVTKALDSNDSETKIEYNDREVIVEVPVTPEGWTNLSNISYEHEGSEYNLSDYLNIAEQAILDNGILETEKTTLETTKEKLEGDVSRIQGLLNNSKAGELNESSIKAFKSLMNESDYQSFEQDYLAANASGRKALLEEKLENLETTYKDLVEDLQSALEDAMFAQEYTADALYAEATSQGLNVLDSRLSDLSQNEKYASLEINLTDENILAFNQTNNETGNEFKDMMEYYRENDNASRLILQECVEKDGVSQFILSFRIGSGENEKAKTVRFNPEYTDELKEDIAQIKASA
jgi:hypothetical protein